MRILLVNYRYFISGGPERYMFNVKRLLEDKGHEVIPFSVQSNRNEETGYSRYFVEPIGGRDATYFDEYRKTPKNIIKMLSRSIYSLEVKKAIQREIDDVRPDIVYIIHFINKLSPSVIRGAKQKGVPVVLRLSDYFLLCPRFDFLRDRKVCEDCITKGYGSCIKHKCVKDSIAASFIRVLSMKIHSLIKVYDDVDAFVTPSAFLKEKLAENGFDKDKLYHIPTFTTWTEKAEESIIGDYGLYFGRITVEKGVETVIKAYEQLPDHRVKIVGDDTTEEAVRLKEYIRDRELDNIEFTGFRQGRELEGLISNARFTIVPSIWYDNLPNTVLESFGHGKPVIASDIGSLPELIENGMNGFLFPAGDYETLADRIRELDDDNLVGHMGISSRDILESRFSSEDHNNRLIKLFKDMINEGKAQKDRKTVG